MQERATLMTRGIKMGPTLLYEGHRDERMDRLYADEMESWAQMGAVEVRAMGMLLTPGGRGGSLGSLARLS